MKITNNITLDFHHDVPEKKTSCVLTIGDTQTIGIAKCSEKDAFARPMGRKLSLTRVLKKSNLCREEKTIVWNTLKQSGVNLAF